MGAGANKEPDPGDLIDISRGLYHHWAVYVGDGYIVHMLAPEGFRSAQVKKEKLQDVVNGHKWCVNNFFDDNREPRPVHEIVEEALSWVGKDVEYSLSDWNCEHFANKCRYGIAKSVQVMMSKLVLPGAVKVADGAMKVSRFIFPFGGPSASFSPSKSSSHSS
ncbi:phospholipase A and acyltransferase 3-like [Scomber japonicus]|uniref:phospholipase A and acyltransferase 3-like n=1 Tax=Scomber japonicus TaxID=13676 RepID=UPI0023059DB8|nr:phospholipase A and acyltransferase 3-like [Scomber japonicus]